MSEACDKTKGVQFLAKVPITKKFLERLDCIPLCSIHDRIIKSNIILKGFCDVSNGTFSLSSSSSSSSCCPIMHDVVEVVESLHLINIEDLDQEVYDLLEILEAEACEVIQNVRELEILVGSGRCGSESSSSSLVSSFSSSSDCCVGPEKIVLVGSVSGVFTNINPTPYVPPNADQCNFFTKPSEEEGIGYYMYFYDTVEHKWALHSYAFSAPLTSTLLGYETTGSNKCEFDGSILVGDFDIIINPYNASSSSSSNSSLSSSSSLPPECYSGNININSNCPDFTSINGLTLEPQVNLDPLYGDCYFALLIVGSSSSGTPDELVVRYSIGGYWEIWSSADGVIAIYVTDNSFNPIGVYEYNTFACSPFNISVDSI